MRAERPSAASSSETPFSSFFSSSFFSPLPSFFSAGAAGAGAANVSALASTSPRLTPSSEARSAFTRAVSGETPAALMTPVRPFSSIGFPAALSSSAPYTYSIVLTPWTLGEPSVTHQLADRGGLAHRLREERFDCFLRNVAGRQREAERPAMGAAHESREALGRRIPDLHRESDRVRGRSRHVGAAFREVDRENLGRVKGGTVDHRAKRDADLERKDLEPGQEARDLAGDRSAGLDDQGVLLEDHLPFLDRRGETGVLELSDDGARLEARGPGGHENVRRSDLPSPSGSRRAGLEELLVERERVPFGRKDRRWVLDLVQERPELGPRGGRLLDRVSNGAVGADGNWMLPVSQLPAHRLEGGGGHSSDPDDRDHRLRNNLGCDRIDASDLLGRYGTTTRHDDLPTRAGPPVPWWSSRKPIRCSSDLARASPSLESGPRPRSARSPPASCRGYRPERGTSGCPSSGSGSNA